MFYFLYKCNKCNAEYIGDEKERTCPQCHGKNTYILSDISEDFVDGDGAEEEM